MWWWEHIAGEVADRQKRNRREKERETDICKTLHSEALMPELELSP